MPLDVEPTEQGNITISQDLLGEDVATVDPDGPMPRYTSHFATCPDAPTFRRD